MPDGPNAARGGDAFDAVRRAYPPILTTAQVAELLDLNPRTVLNMAGDGRLPASRLPGARKFHFLLEDIIDTLKTHRVTPGEIDLDLDADADVEA